MSHSEDRGQFDVDAMALAEMPLEEVAAVLPKLLAEGEQRGWVGVLTQHRLDRAEARLTTA